MFNCTAQSDAICRRVGKWIQKGRILRLGAIRPTRAMIFRRNSKLWLNPRPCRGYLTSALRCQMSRTPRHAQCVTKPFCKTCIQISAVELVMCPLSEYRGLPSCSTVHLPVPHSIFDGEYDAVIQRRLLSKN